MPEEMEVAQKLILNYVQLQHYANEMADVAKSKAIKRSSGLLKRDPFLQYGVPCVGGCLNKSNLPHRVKHSVILPNDGFVSDLIICDAHVARGHSGRQQTLAYIRESFWLIKASSSVRKAIANCVTCRNLFEQPNTQKMADLSTDRIVTDKPPFTFVGLDCFGTFFVKQGRSRVERYSVVFSCLVTTTVHIEVIHSMDTSSFINALPRFIARRGQVEEFRSDNGTNLVGGERELQQSIKNWNQAQIHSYLLQKNIVSCIFILLSRESNQCAIQARLESCQPSVYHTKMGESR